MHRIIQKVKVFILSGFLLAPLLAPMALTSAVSAASGPCPGSDATYPVDCAKIPLGCPGSSQQGPVAPTDTLKCPFNPVPLNGFTCPAKKCVFPSGKVINGGCVGQGSDGKDTVETDSAICANDCTTSSDCSFINKYIYPLINLLAAFVGVAVVISIIIGGIQYSSSAGDPQKVSAAKGRIRNAIIALITFIFLYALLNFLVPGGLFA